MNSLELESQKEIATYYQQRFQNGSGEVALCATKVCAYTEAGKKSAVALTYDKAASAWMFLGLGGTQEKAYQHRPVNDSLNSSSHCGVEFVRVLNTQSDEIRVTLGCAAIPRHKA